MAVINDHCKPDEPIRQLYNAVCDTDIYKSTPAFVGRIQNGIIEFKSLVGIKLYRILSFYADRKNAGENIMGIDIVVEVHNIFFKDELLNSFH